MTIIDLIEGIVRILGVDGEVVGTGFIVSDDGLIATCAHVVKEADAGPGDVVAVHLQAIDHRLSARVVGEWWSDVENEDVAILRPEEALPEGVRSLKLGESSGTNDHKVRTFGFPEVGSVEGVWGRGEIVGIVKEGGHAWIQLRSSEITSGFSGAPICDESRRRVIGMVVTIAETDSYSRLQETAFVVPSETLQEICPELKVKDLCPFRGLLPFMEEDADFFFGRDSMINVFLDKLRGNLDFLALVGPPGSGKSSLIRAGILPKIRRGEVPRLRNAKIVTFLPRINPINAFNEAAQQSGICYNDFEIWSGIRSYLKESPDSRVVIFIDRFEELFALSLDHERAELLQGLSDLLKDHLPVTLIITLRADFYESLLSTSLGDSLNISQLNMQSMSEDELREAISMPAQVVGLQVEAGLTDLIIKDLKSTKNPLPLLEFALTQLWDYRKYNILTHEAYRKIRGVTGAVGEWATDVYNHLDESEKLLCQRIFTRLIQYGEGDSPDTRRCSTLLELTENEDERSVLSLINTLVDSHLLVTDRNPETRVKTVEIVHDSLLREWTQLREWIRDQRGFLIWRQRLDDRINEWHNRDRDDSSLIRGSALAEAENWLEKHDNDLSLTEQSYIRASSELRNSIQSGEERRRRRVVVGLTAFSIIVMILAGFAAYQWYDIREKKSQIEASHLASKSLFMATVDLSESIRSSVESLKISRTLEGDQALLNGLELLPPHFVRVVHDDDINCLVFSPDGSLIVTASSDNSVRIWDPSSGRELKRWYHDDDVNAVVFSPDGTLIASASGDSITMILDASSYNDRPPLKLKHNGSVNQVIFSPDGTTLATAGYDNTVRIWDVSTGNEIRCIRYGNRVEDLALSPDGKMLATGDWDSVIRILEVHSGREITRMSHEDDINSLEFSPDGTFLATASWDGTAKIWELATGKELWRLNHSDNVRDVAFNPDGTLLATASDDRTARIWDTITGKELWRLNHKDDVCDVVFSPDGNLVATASDDKTARVWIAASGDEYLKVYHQDKVNSVSFSPNGAFLATTSDDNTARLWRIPDKKFVPVMPSVTHDDHIHDLAFCPGGRRLATASDDNTARIWDVSTGNELANFSYDSYVVSLALTRRLLATACENRTYVWDYASGEEFSTLNHEHKISDIEFSPDGMLLATACNKVVYIWDLESNKKFLIMNHTKGVHDVAFSPDGAYLATGCTDGAYIWDLANKKEFSKLNLAGIVRSVAFSPDGRFLAASCNSSTYIWDLVNKKEISRQDHTGDVLSVAFSPDGKFLATAGEDQEAKVWDLASNKVIAIRKHSGDVNVVAFSPDGKFLATGSSDKTARIWMWRADDMIKEAQERLDLY